MDLSHCFTVSGSVEQTWAELRDIAAIVDCFPGASLASIDPPSFEASCKVDLEAIQVAYHGTGIFLEDEDGAPRFTVNARGTDRHGFGDAEILISVVLTDAYDGSTGTQVSVITDLRLDGPAGALDRDHLQEVSDALLAQFATCLEAHVSSAHRG